MCRGDKNNSRGNKTNHSITKLSKEKQGNFTKLVWFGRLENIVSDGCTILHDYGSSFAFKSWTAESANFGISNGLDVTAFAPK